MHRAALFVTVAAVAGAPVPAQDGVSSAAASIVRAQAARGHVPLPSAFIVEEILNYHRHRIARPEGGAALALDARVGEVCPADGGTRHVLQVGLATAAAAPHGPRSPAELVFVIDCSGSMQDDAKLERVREALRTLVARLEPEDRISIVGYADAARVVLPRRCVQAREEIRRAIDALEPEGATNLHAGLMLGLELAAGCEGRANRRVILLTDGIANRGIVDADRISAEARARAGKEIAVSTIGVGDDVQHELLRRIARETRGQNHFLADAGDIAKVFVQELCSLVVPAARQVRVRIELDGELQVDRLFGYETQFGDGRLSFRLEDLGSDSTMVLLAELKPCLATAGRSRFPIRVVVEAQDARTGQRIRLEQVVSVQTAGAGCADAEVTRNWKIAQLAHGMRAAAVLHEQGLDARALDRLDHSLREIGPAEDPDLARVAATAQDLRRALEGSACRDR